MAKYRGRVDCHLEPASGDTVGTHSRASGEFFVNLVQHISASKDDLGIEMIAWDYGDGGTGWNFWDEDGPTGHGAFACFRFHSASLGSFDCLVYAVTGSSVSFTGSLKIDTSSASDGYYTNRNVGIAFACHPSGTVTGTFQSTLGPWSGGYGEGADIQTLTPMWKTGSNGKGAFFPRPNSKFGQNETDRSALTGMGAITMNNSRAHFVVSEDSLTVVVQPEFGTDDDHKVIHFGSYTPRSGVVADSPYLMWSNGNEDTYNTFDAGWPTGHGSKTRVDNTPQGGIAHPDVSNGVKSFSWVHNYGLDIYNGYNDYINSGSFEKFPTWVALNEAPQRGILGVLNHIYLGVGMSNKSVDTLSSSVCFGSNTLASGKWIMPWSGSAPGTLTNTRTGRTFSIG